MSVRGVDAAADERVLIWAAPRDGQLTRDFLRDAGFAAHTFSDAAAFCEAIGAGAAVLILAEELLGHPHSAPLQRLLSEQPAWSDIPLVLVARGESTVGGLTRILEDYGGFMVLHRPLSLDTLCSAVGAALRARRRQYELRDLLAQREELERRREEFLAMLAHELRNPLSSIRTGLQVMRIAETQDLVLRTQTILERQVQNLSRIIDDLLDVSRITRGKIQLKRELLDVHEVLARVVEARTRLAAEKGLRVQLEPADGPPVQVHADVTRLEQMLDNVLTNAIKYTPAGGSVCLQAEAEADAAVIRVRDSGIGIPPHMLESVFELFTQTEHTLDRTSGGLGIGLTVVRTLAELHGGSVRAWSEGRDKGTEIVIRLPLMSEQLAPSVQSVAAAPDGTRSRRILLVEDNHDTAELLATYLRSKGHIVSVAYDGAAGFRAALRELPEFIICDIGLPGMDGYALAQALRQAAELEDCTLVAVTGYGEARDRERGQCAGFQHYIVKPADPELIARIVTS